jgi:excisionase family DNA binding protein
MLEKYDIFILIYKVKRIMLNIDEASKFLNVSKRTLRNWEKENKIISYRTPGKHRRYEEKDLLKIIGKDDNR